MLPDQAFRLLSLVSLRDYYDEKSDKLQITTGDVPSMGLDVPEWSECYCVDAATYIHLDHLDPVPTA